MNDLRKYISKADSALQNHDFEGVISAIQKVWNPVRHIESNETRLKCEEIDSMISDAARKIGIAKTMIHELYPLSNTDK